MAKRQSLQDQLDQLAAFKIDPTTPAARTAITAALANGQGVLVDKAARTAGASAGLYRDELTAAFARLMEAGASSDKGCTAKTSIAAVLYEAGADVPDTFTAGIRHVQMESTWGGSTDTAAELRGVCAMGLVRIGHRGVMVELTDLLGDPEPQARIAAARALAYAGQDAGALLLRLKLLTGDREEAVIAECLASLARIAVPHAIPFVARYLDSTFSDTRDAAVLALGESRRPEAFAVLQQHLEHPALDRDARRTVFVALATLRVPAATALLLTRAADAPVTEALDAIEALTALRRDSAVRNRLTEIVEQRDDASLIAAAQKLAL